MSNADQMLRRFWFAIPSSFGFGVTAYSIGDAFFLLESEGILIDHTVEVIVDIDVSTLDPNHILPNAGPPCFRGVWFPCFNIGWIEPGAHHPLRGGSIKPARPFVCQIKIAANDNEDNS